MPGTIIFKPIQANLTHNTDFIGKMNPYCSIMLGNSSFKSSICHKGGKHPHWQDAVPVPIQGNESLALVEVLDKDRITKDDTIGCCAVNLQEIQSQGTVSKWYPLFYMNKSAGEILLEATFEPARGTELKETGLLEPPQQSLQQASFSTAENSRLSHNSAMTHTCVTEAGEHFLSQRNEQLVASEQPFVGYIREEGNVAEVPRKTYVEKHEIVEPHTFLKAVDAVEIRPVWKEVEVFEPVKVIKDVEYTVAVPVMKQIEVTEPVVMLKEIETMEPRVVPKIIQVVEHVPVKRQIEFVEMKHEVKEVETFEPRTGVTQVEVIEHVPVTKTVTVTEPVIVQKAVEFVEPVITTTTVTKEIVEPVVVGEKITMEKGIATLLGVREDVRIVGESERLVSDFEKMKVKEKVIIGNESVRQGDEVVEFETSQGKEVL